MRLAPSAPLRQEDANRCIAMLRAAGISGKRRVSMTALREGFESLGCTDVRPLLSSGNILFTPPPGRRRNLTPRILKMLQERMGLSVGVFLLPRQQLSGLLAQAPDWWGGTDREMCHNLILLLPPFTAQQLLEVLGPPRSGVERIALCGEAVFWSFRRAEYRKCIWWSGTARPAIAPHLTIRTAGTLRKILAL